MSILLLIRRGFQVCGILFIFRIVTPGTERMPLPSMFDARCSVGAAFINGKIIVCGGCLN